MKPWLTEICERVNARRDIPPNTQQDALDALYATFASYVSGQCGDLISCLIERCEQLQQALDYKPGACRMLSLGDSCDCTLCKQSLEIDRLRRLEKALPKTADGVPIVPGMPLYYPPKSYSHCEVLAVHTDKTISMRGVGWNGDTWNEWHQVGDYGYSTREAAEEAEKARDV